MQNRPKTFMNAREQGLARPFVGRPKRWTSNPVPAQPKSNQNAQRSYERYLALARSEGQSGNTIAAENYYQYAEHYYRSMSSDPEAV
jgi:Domain of unknown function (DUF4167)